MEEAFLKQLITFRKEVHQNPELSQKEFETQNSILSFLKEIGVEGKKVGETGVLVSFDSGKAGKEVLIRSDHDALPIQEVNAFEYKSKVNGVSHKCGHDGHTAILCGVAHYFKENPIKKGRVSLVFQPAEENGEGAKAVLRDPIFKVAPDFVFALHNLPGFPLHKVILREGTFTAAAKSIIIKLDGKTSHAAEPENGINPASAISEIIQFFNQVSRPDSSRNDFALTTPIYINMGTTSYGVSAGHGEVHYTLRTWNNDIMNSLVSALESEIQRISKEHMLKVTISYTEEFDSSLNDKEAVSLIKKAIESNKLDSEERTDPFKWGEDFGLYTQKYKGAMFGLGAGLDCPSLHNPDYDFPDAIIETGVKMFTTITEYAIQDH